MAAERIMIILTLIFLSLALFCGCINGPKKSGYDCRYENVTVWIDSLTSNRSIEAIKNEFINDENISITNKVDGDSWYIILKNSISMLSQENSSRIDTLCHFRTNEIDILLKYHSQNPFSDEIDNDEEKEQWEKKVNEQYNSDRTVLDQYMNSLLLYFNTRYDLTHKEIEYGEKYSMERK